MKEFNNIPIRVFFKRWCEDQGKTFPVSTNKEDFITRFNKSGELKTNIYKYTEDEGRVQLEEQYYDEDEISNVHNFVRSKFKQYTREQGMLLDIELIV